MSLSETDLDLLADYAEGLLDPERAEQVARRIDADPEWALTHQLLTGVDPRLDQAVSTYAAATPELPADVAARIDAAISDERERADSAARAPIQLEAARRRRQSRLSLVGLSAAAAVVVAVIFGLTALGLNLGGSSKSASTAEAPAGTAAPGDLSALAGVTITHSGANYSQRSLSAVQAQPMDTFGSPPEISGSPTTRGARPNAAPDPLQRLTQPADLAVCLDAVRAVHPGAVTAVDYARYLGQPALIITLASPRLRVAVGAECGLPNAADDELAAVPMR